MEATRISQAEAIKMIKDYKEGKFFSVSFIKRTDGSLRKMNCRKGVTVGVTGAGLKFDPEKENLVPVRDMQKRAFRMITLDNIKTVSMKGKKYVVSG